MIDVVVAKDALLHTRLANTLDHRVMVESIGQDQTTGDQLGDGRDASLVRDIAGRKDQCCLLAVEIGKLALELYERMAGAGDIAGPAGSRSQLASSLHHGGDHLWVLSHPEIVVGAPDHDVLRSMRGMPHGIGKASGDALKVREHTVTPFLLQTRDRIRKETVITRNSWLRDTPLPIDHIARISGRRRSKSPQRNDVLYAAWFAGVQRCGFRHRQIPLLAYELCRSAMRADPARIVPHGPRSGRSKLSCNIRAMFIRIVSQTLS